MVMIFSSKKALNHLLEKGFVITFRKLKPYERKHGTDWITDRRCGKKICDVLVFGLNVPAYFIESLLEPFAEFSGFKDVDDWMDEINALNGGKMKPGMPGELFCVVRRNCNDAKDAKA